MPRTATIQGPDGRTATLTIPDGATDEQIQAKMQQVKAELSKQPAPQQAAPAPAEAPAAAEKPTLQEVEGDPSKLAEYAKTAYDLTTQYNPVSLLHRAGKAAMDLGWDTLAGYGGDIIAGWAGITDLMTGGDATTASRSIKGVQRAVGGLSELENPDVLAAVSAAAPALIAANQWVDDVIYASGAENPYAATAIKGAITTLVEAIPLARPVSQAKRAAVQQARKRLRDVEARADELGLSLDATKIEDSVRSLATRETLPRGSAMPEVRAKLQAARDQQKQVVDDLYRNARANTAYVPTRGMPGLADRIESSLAGFDIAEMKSVNNRLDDLRNIQTRIPSSPRGMPEGQRLDYIEFNELDNVRKRINSRLGDIKNNPKRKSEFKALNKVKAQLNEFADQQFNTGAIHLASGGDPMAVKRLWDVSRKEHGEWAKRFDANKTIKQLLDGDATPETLRQWLVGANALGAKSQASSTLKRIKELTGNDSDLIRTMQMDFLHDVAEPLFKDIPNYKGFLNNYDRMIAKNPTFVKELGLDRSSVAQMHKAVKAIVQMPPAARLSINLNRMLSVFLFGHGIARRALLVRTAKTALDKVTMKDRISRKQILYNMADIDGEKALRMVQPSDALYGGAAASYILGHPAEDEY